MDIIGKVLELSTELIIAAVSFIAGIISKSIIDKLKSKREHDINLHKKINTILSPETMSDFFITLGHNIFHQGHLTALHEYNSLCKHADIYFFDKKVQKHKEEFDQALDELMNFMGQHFFTSRKPNSEHFELNIHLLEDYEPHEVQMYEERNRERINKLSILEEKAKDKYNKYIKVAKNQLRI